MYLKKLRNNRIALVESRYVRKGAAGNTHGYSAAVTLCRLSSGATSLPSETAKKMTEDQLRYLEENLFKPNLRLEAEARAAAEARATDPGWRLKEAARLVAEVRELCVHKAVDITAISAVRCELDALQLPTPQERPAAPRAVDPLKAAIQAVNAATGAVAGGHYGEAPDVGVRESLVYRSWQALNDSLTGSAENSLQRALQRRGWVKTKGASR